MLLFEEKIKFNRDAFTSKVKQIAIRLQINPDWLMVVINSETGGTFDAQIVNKQKSSTAGYDENLLLVKPAGISDSINPYERARYRATGLIQFMPRTAKSLGISTQGLFKMTPVEQLDYVEKYFLPVKGKIKKFEDLYLYTFYPFSVGKPDDYIIGSERGLEYANKIVQQNPLDFNHDGHLSVAEFKQFIYKKLPSGIIEKLKKKWNSTPHPSFPGSSLSHLPPSDM